MKMLALGAALLAVANVSEAQECDWRVISDRIDPMTDARVCVIGSQAAQLSVAVRGRAVTFLTASAYRHGNDGLTLRIDHNPAIYIGEERSTENFGNSARQALSQIRTGERIRTSFRDYPSSKEGDAPICSLPALIDACSAPSSPDAGSATP